MKYCAAAISSAHVGNNQLPYLCAGFLYVFVSSLAIIQFFLVTFLLIGISILSVATAIRGISALLSL